MNIDNLKDDDIVEKIMPRIEQIDKEIELTADKLILLKNQREIYIRSFNKSAKNSNLPIIMEPIRLHRDIITEFSKISSTN